MKPTLIALLVALFVIQTPVVAQKKELDVIKGLIYYSDAPNALYHHIADQAYDYLDKRSEKIKTINTLAEWQQRQKWVHKTLTDAVGQFPDKTPLNAKITKTIIKDGYKIEHIIYESQSGFYVTSSLFIPDNSVKAPTIVYCSGHSSTGYRSYQGTILNLVKKGFVVFAFDPVGQGERLQYFNPQTGKSVFKWPAFEHSYTGAQSFITGNSLANTMIWDGIRAIDYLVTRREVDTNRIGITGRSGGGTQSAYIAAFDKRIKAVAPGNYITNLTRLFQTIGPQDAEQNFFYGIQRGLDMADLLAVRAPKPALMVTTTLDMFPIQGALETADEVSRVYKAYGKPENFGMVTDNAPHTSTKKNREAMYAFFQKFLDNPGDPTDQTIEDLSTEELQVTTTGQVSTALNSETVFSLNSKDAALRIKKLDQVRKSTPAYLAEMLVAAKKLSGYHEPAISSKQPLFFGRVQRTGYVIEKYVLQSEENYPIPYFLLIPENPTGKGMIYLNPAGKAADASEGGEMEWFVKKGVTVLAPDIVGTGEMGPGTFRGDSYIDSVSYNVWFASIVIHRSIVGIQVGDVIKLTDQLKKDRNVAEIFALAKREFAPVLLHAAAFSKDIDRVALISPYSSYRSIVMNPKYDQTFLHSTVAGSIGVYDLPDLAASLAPRKLILVGVTDGNGSSANTNDINKDLKVIADAYRNTGKQIQIFPASEAGDKLYDIYKHWMGN